MKHSDFLTFHDTCTKKMREITAAKGHDYSFGHSQFANLECVERLGICSTEVGVLTRMTDKISRIASYAQSNTLLVKDESVEDTLLDLANYCLLLAGYLKYRKEKRESYTISE